MRMTSSCPEGGKEMMRCVNFLKVRNQSSLECSRNDDEWFESIERRDWRPGTQMKSFWRFRKSISKGAHWLKCSGQVDWFWMKRVEQMNGIMLQWFQLKVVKEKDRASEWDWNCLETCCHLLIIDRQGTFCTAQHWTFSSFPWSCSRTSCDVAFNKLQWTRVQLC